MSALRYSYEDYVAMVESVRSWVEKRFFFFVEGGFIRVGRGL